LPKGRNNPFLNNASLNNTHAVLLEAYQWQRLFKARLREIREAEPFKEVISTEFAERYKTRPDDRELDSYEGEIIQRKISTGE
jgi:hypothetical protein